MASGRIDVLLVEDDKFDRMAVERQVIKMDMPYNMFFAHSQTEAKALLKKQNFDVVLLDYMLGDGSGLDLLPELQDIPSIVITGAGSEEVAIEAMRRGAYDYLIKDGTGNFLTVLPLTIATVMERRQAERALRESEARYRGLSEFANSVLHNVSNVLNSIAASTEVIRKGVMDTRAHQLPRLTHLLESNLGHDFLNDDPKGRKILPYLNALEGKLSEERHLAMTEIVGIQKNLQLIRDIVDTQQSQETINTPLATCPLKDIISDAVKVSRPYLEKMGVQVHELCTQPIRLEIHRATLTHILINLLKNGADAVAENVLSDRHIYLEGRLQGDHASLVIRDNGHGIDQEHLARLFTHGFTTKPGGHGFGLYYCANAMSDMGGMIEAESEGPGLGSSIKLTFNPAQVVTTSY